MNTRHDIDMRKPMNLFGDTHVPRTETIDKTTGENCSKKYPPKRVMVFDVLGETFGKKVYGTRLN